MQQISDISVLRVPAEDKIHSMGGFLVDIKVLPRKKIIIHFDKLQGGVEVGDCIEISRYINVQFENSGLWEQYELEVSSPGLDQPFRVVQQYHKAVGKEIRIIATDGQAVSGKLISAGEEGIEILENIPGRKNRQQAEEESRKEFFPYSGIKEAKCIISFRN